MAKNEEIIDFLKKMLSLSVTRDQLANPNTGLVISIYSRFLEEFGVQLPTSPDLMACSNVTNIESMENIIYPIHIFKEVGKLVQPLGFDDMRLTDILMPKKVRTNKIISILCTICVRYFKIKRTWLEIETNGYNIKLSKNELEQKNLELKHSIEEKSMHLASLSDKSISLEKEKAALVDENKKKKKDFEDQSDESRVLKSEIMKLEDKRCQQDIELSKSKEKNNEAEALILKSPEKQIQISNNKQSELDELKNEVLKKKHQHQDILKKLDCHKAVFNSLKPSIEEISSLFQMHSQTDNQYENLEGIKQEVNAIQDELKNIAIEDQETLAAKQAWQSKRNESLRQFQREYAKLRELQIGVQQSEKDVVAIVKKMEDKLQKKMQAKQTMENEHAGLDTIFSEMENRSSRIHVEFLEKYYDHICK